MIIFGKRNWTFIPIDEDIFYSLPQTRQESFYINEIHFAKELDQKHLNKTIKDMVRERKEQIDEWVETRRKYDDHEYTKNFINNRIQEIVQDINRLEKIIPTIKKKDDFESFEIKIARAKTCPIPKIHEFNYFKKSSCVFHNEKTASMHYNEKDNTVHCFGCGKHADVIAVYQAKYNLSFKEAVKHLC